MSFKVLSQAGLATERRNLIIRKSKSILTGEKIKGKQLRQIQKKPVYEELQEKVDQKVMIRSTRRKSKSYAFNVQGRNEFYKTMQNPDTPGSGHYNINYNFSKSRQPIAFITPSKPLSPPLHSPISPSQESIQQYKSPIIPKAKMRKVRTLKKCKSVDFSKMVKRMPMFSPGTVAEYRTIDFPATKACPTIKFSRQSQRRELFTKTAGPDYNPDKGKVLPKLTVNIEFQKYSPRKVQEKIKEMPMPHSVNYEAVQPKVRSVSMGKASPRERYPNSKLPLYMQTAINKFEVPVTPRDEFYKSLPFLQIPEFSKSRSGLGGYSSG